MCPVAAESKNSKPSSKKKINKKINTNLETVVEEDSNKNTQNLQTSSELNESSIEKNNEFSEDDNNFILEGYFGNSITSNSKIKLHMFKCVSLLNEVLWSMISEISSKKVFDFVSYTDKMLKRYEKQFDYYNSLRTSI